MRFALALCLALAACSVDPLPLPDAGPDGGSGRVCSPGAQVACACVGGAAGAQVCTSDGSGYSACECPDAGSGVDVVEVDAGSDSGPREVGVVDTGAVDAGSNDVSGGDTGSDAGTVDAGVCPNGRTAVCDGRMISLVNGVRDDAGVWHHCGMCGVTCAVGEGCVSCRCER